MNVNKVYNCQSDSDEHAASLAVSAPARRSPILSSQPPVSSRDGSIYRNNDVVQSAKFESRSRGFKSESNKLDET